MSRKRDLEKSTSDDPVIDNNDQMDDNNDDDNSNELEITKRSRTEVPGSDECCGIIKSVEMINFMCHAHITVKLGKNINFITGKNGSGKSAILVAIALGLGAKLNSVARGKTISSFVREGTNQAVIRIKLSNKNIQDAFKPNEYGETITVERTIKAQGGSSFKVKSASGKIISQKAEEVRQICNCFNIQLDNPCALLMQDTAKDFLHSSNAQRKYKFFTDATMVAVTENWLSESCAKIRTCGENVQRDKELLRSLRERKNRLREEYDSRKHLEELKNQILQQQGVLAWSLVHDQEATAAGLRRRLSKLDDNRRKLEAEMNAAEKEFLKAQEEERQVKAEAEQFSAEMVALKMEHAAVRTRLRDAKQQLATAQDELQSAQEDLRTEQNKLKRMEVSLARARAAAQQEAAGRGRAEQERAQRIERAQAASDAAVREAHQAEVDHRERAEIKQQVQQRLAAANREVSDAQQHVRRAQNDLAQARQATNDPLAALHPQARRVDQALKGLGAHAPVGPIGLMVKLKDAKWALPVECILNKDLGAYVVGTHEARQKCEQALRRLNSNYTPTIIVQPAFHERHRVPAALLNSREMSALNAIDSENVPPCIFNTLLDVGRVEMTLLFDSDDEAMNTLFRPNRAANAPKIGYSKDGTQFQVRGGSHNVMRRQRERASVLGVDSSSRVAAAQQSLQDAEKVLNERNAIAQRISAELANERNKENRALEILQDAESKARRLTQLLVKAKQEAERGDQGNAANQVLLLEEDLKKKKDDCKRAQENVEKMQADVDKFENLKQPLEEAYAQCQTKEQAVQEKLDDVDRRLSPCETQLAASVYKKSGAQKSMDRLKRAMEPLEEQSRVATAAAEKARKDTEELYETEVHTEDSSGKIKTLLNSLENALKKAEAGGRPIDIIRTEYAQCSRTYKASRKNIQQLTAWSNHMLNSLVQRLSNVDRFKRQIAARVDMLFNSILSWQQHSGSIKCDHTEKTLSVDVELNRASARSTKTLSGGERMFSTVSLLLALWSAMEVPFRALDEFDVFMDPVNRKISIDLLVMTARHDKTRQYIFISPHSVAQIPNAPDVHVTKMADPDRAQSTIELFSGNN